MKQFICCLLTITLLFPSCRKGAQSKDVKFHGYALVGDGNNNDSTFFELSYENKSGSPLLEPYARIAIKDTSSKLIKPILFSDSKNFAAIPAHTWFKVYFYANGFQFSDEVGKVKCYLSWTNSKGKRSFRRSVESD